MTKHTPGPWHVTSDVEPGSIKIIGGPKQYSIAGLYFTGYPQDTEANARLIAAAPETAAERDRLREVNADLLAALEDIRNAYQRHFDVMPVAWQTFDNIAEAAIAKATQS